MIKPIIILVVGLWALGCQEISRENSKSHSAPQSNVLKGMSFEGKSLSFVTWDRTYLKKQESRGDQFNVTYSLGGFYDPLHYFLDADNKLIHPYKSELVVHEDPAVGISKQVFHANLKAAFKEFEKHIPVCFLEVDYTKEIPDVVFLSSNLGAGIASSQPGRMNFNRSYGAAATGTAVIMHEFGHLLGLADTNVGGNVMSRVYSGLVQLSQDDIAGFQSVYGAGKCEASEPKKRLRVRVANKSATTALLKWPGVFTYFRSNSSPGPYGLQIELSLEGGSFVKIAEPFPGSETGYQLGNLEPDTNYRARVRVEMRPEVETGGCERVFRYNKGDKVYEPIPNMTLNWTPIEGLDLEIYRYPHERSAGEFVTRIDHTQSSYLVKESLFPEANYHACLKKSIRTNPVYFTSEVSFKTESTMMAPRPLFQKTVGSYFTQANSIEINGITQHIVARISQDKSSVLMFKQTGTYAEKDGQEIWQTDRRINHISIFELGGLMGYL